jgi:hypothetical protein
MGPSSTDTAKKGIPGFHRFYRSKRKGIRHKEHKEHIGSIIPMTGHSFEDAEPSGFIFCIVTFVLFEAIDSLR